MNIPGNDGGVRSILIAHSKALFQVPRSSNRDTLACMKTVDPARVPPWKRKKPAGKSTPLTTAQVEAARDRAAQAGRRYPNLVDNMWAGKHVPRKVLGDADEK